MQRIPIICLILFLSSMVKGADYFWIAGSGDWSDISHWATTSGGSSTYPQTPTANDNVFFDANSFTTTGAVVTINGTIANCRNMDWTGAKSSPTFRITSDLTNIQIYGSVKFINAMTFSHAGIITFQTASQNVSLDFAGHTLGKKITFAGTGSWNIDSDVSVSDEISVLQGSINFKNANITANYFLSKSEENRLINFANSKIKLNGASIDPNFYGYEYNKYSLDIFGTNFKSTGGTSTIEFTSPTGKLGMQKGGVVELGNVIFSSSTGIAEILNYEGKSNLKLTGDLELKHNANLLSNMTLKKLILSPGFIYKMADGGNFILDEIQATGSCTKMTFLNSVVATVPVNITTSNAFTVDYITLRDIHITGASATTNNTIDLGNNTGWVFTNKTSQDFYWIGGNGNWSQGSHWAIASGGTGTGCIPTAVDNVFFDDKSFTAQKQSMTIDVDAAFAKDFIWDNVKDSSRMTVLNAAQNLYINGSLHFAPNMINDFVATISFISDTKVNTIQSHDIQFKNDVYFDNKNGGWTIVDNMYVYNYLFHVSGEVTFDNVEVNVNKYLSQYILPRKLNLKASKLHITSRNQKYDGPEFIIDSQNYLLDAGTSKIVLDNFYWTNINVRNSTTKNLEFYDIEMNAYSSNFYFENSNNSKYKIHHFKFIQDGQLSGEGNVEKLEFSPGHSYNFSSDMTIDTLLAKSNCSSSIALKSTFYTNKRPTLTFTTAQNVEGVYVKNLIAILPSGKVNAINSLDGGNNTGWDFTNGTGRTLYWVHHTNYWDDVANWSLTSGGVGGQCLPTILDDVIFDNNSFPMKNEIINTWIQQGYCKDFTFNVDGFNGEIYLLSLHMSGNLNLQKNMKWQIQDLFTIGSLGNVQTLRTNAIPLLNLYVEGLSTVTPVDNLKLLSTLKIGSGKFSATNKTIESSTLYNGGDISGAEFELISCKYIVFGNSPYPSSIMYFDDRVKVNTASSTIEFKGNEASIYLNNKSDKFGQILFSNIAGIGHVNTAPEVVMSKLEFRGDGRIHKNYLSNLSFTADTLLLASGHFYQIESGTTVRIKNLLQARGNNCNPISLTSSKVGEKAIINMPASGKVNADFIEMRDITGNGGAKFDAGPYSTNIDNSNVNWIFPDLQIDNNIGVLGPDRFICNGATALLDAFSFTPDEKYLWNDGSTSPQLSTSTPGKYFVKIEFQNNCIITDTLQLFTPQSFSNFLPADTVICDGKPLNIGPSNIPIQDFEFLWSTGEKIPEVMVSKSGLYKLTISKDNCDFSDSTFIDYIDIQSVNLGQDISACEGDKITLAVSSGNADVLWSDGTIIDSIEVNSSGLFWAKVSKDICSISDTINVTFNAIPVFELGNDTSFCEGNNLVLSINIPNVAVKWQDGSTNPTFTAITTGEYFATAELNNCYAADTVKLTVNPTPKFSLGNDTTLCNEEFLTLNPGIVGDQISWQNGSSPPTFTANAPGIYFAKVIKDGCDFTDSIDVSYIQINKPKIGSDTTICDGEMIVLTANNVNGDVLKWSGGENTQSINVTKQGTYWLESQKGSCIQSDTVTLTILKVPTVNLQANYTFCLGESKTIIAEGNFDQFTWVGQNVGAELIADSEGVYAYTAMLAQCKASGEIELTEIVVPVPDLGGEIEKCQNEIYRIDIPIIQGTQAKWQDGKTGFSYEARSGGLYVVTISSRGCEASDSVLITDRFCNNTVLFFPNVIMPDAPDNNLFFPEVNPEFAIVTYNLVVADRWGNIVFESKSLEEGWNGKFNGSDLSPGVYAFAAKFDYMGRKEGNDVMSGTVTVVR